MARDMYGSRLVQHSLLQMGDHVERKGGPVCKEADSQHTPVDGSLGNVMLEPVQYGIRRLFEALVKKSEQERWEAATSNGIPLKLGLTDKEWLNFRSRYFTRKRRRDLSSLSRYGGLCSLNEQGKAPQWQAMLRLCVEKGVGFYHAEAPSRVVLRWSADGAIHLLQTIHTSKEVQDKYMLTQGI